jgi:FMN phosphatase YigB (HAD superfamily)
MVKSTMSAPVRLVCFDLGGVLVRICQSWAEAYRAAGLDIREEPAHRSVRARRLELLNLHGIGRITIDDWAAGTSAALEGVYSADELKRAHHAFILEQHPGAIELVDELHAAGIATACLSNTNHTHWLRLVHRDGDRALEGTPEYPTVVRLQRHFASHLLGLAKPDDEIYARFEELTGLGPNAILFFDDLEENVGAARRRGWHAEQVTASHFDAVTQMRQHLRRRGVV